MPIAKKAIIVKGGIAMPAGVAADIVDDTPAVPEKCGDIAAALLSASSLPEACRMMLVAGLENSLGVDPSSRDSSQEMIVSFIGEVLARRKAELATRMECFEANVACAKTLAEEHEELVLHADEDVAKEASLVSAQRAIFDEDDNQVKQARDLAEAAESARSANEANLLAFDVERETCHQGRKLVDEGAGVGDINTQQLTETTSTIQKLATKLGLEQSLVLTLQFLTKKPREEWSMLEMSASKMMGETFAKHTEELQTHIDAGQADAPGLLAVAEVAQEKLAATKERSVVSETSLHEAEARHHNIESTCKGVKNIAKESATELERARHELSMSQSELTAFCEGPLETFLTLNGSPAVERSAAREAAAKCKADFSESKDEHCSKKARLDNSPLASKEEDNEEMSTAAALQEQILPMEQAEAEAQAVVA